MAAALSLLRTPGPARRFLLAYAQSSLGAGVTLVALPLVALERYGSPLAVSAVLLAEFLPLMLLGARLGALADRWPRTACLVGADAVRCAALLGVVLVSSLPAMLVLVAVTGAATGVWRPAAMAGLSRLDPGGGDGAITALYGTVTNVSRTGGALVAGLLFAVVGSVTAIGVDAATFGISAVLLVTVPLGTARAVEEDGEDDRTLDGNAAVTALIAASSAMMLTAGIANVAEPVFVTRDLGAGAGGFAAALVAWGLGGALGSLSGARSEGELVIRRRYVLALALTGAGYLVSGAGSVLPVLLAGFALNGFGNGAVLVHERLLMRRLVPEAQLGRAFGRVECAASWAFAGALATGGILVAASGARITMLAAGGATIVVAALAVRPLGALGRPSSVLSTLDHGSSPMPANRG